MRRSGYLFFCLLLLPGCVTQEGALTSHLTSCGLLTEGEFGSGTLRPIYAPDACYQQCLLEADCERLEAALCRTSVDLLLACDRRCAHHCEDGSLVAVERVCNGAPDCADASDEAGCPGRGDIVCDDGTRVVGVRCDGIWTCPDGTDEMDCPTPPQSMCDGRFFSEYERCDGYRACSDGADEAGCPAFTCDDGRRITYRAEGPLRTGSPRCDGWTQCSDGSDEAGCAHLELDCIP